MDKNDTLTWHERQFDQLTAHELYKLMRLRVDVFVVEQQCPYPELDGQDLLGNTAHLFAKTDQQPVAYARVLAPYHTPDKAAGWSAPAVHIGRVVVAPEYRGQGLATQLMRRALFYCTEHFAQYDQALAAQVEVEAFYAALGFSVCSEPYLEDGIPHIDMRRLAHST